MKIAFINDFSSRDAETQGGVEIYLRQLIPALQSEGLEIEEIALDKFTSTKNSRLQKMGLRWTTHISHKISEKLQQLKPDIIHLHKVDTAARAVYLAAREYPAPVIHSIHDLYSVQEDRREEGTFKKIINTPLQQLLSNEIEKSVDGFLCYSWFMKELITEKFPDSICNFTPLFYDKEIFYNDPDFARDENTLLYVGRIEKEKGIFFLLDLFRNSMLNRDLRLEIAGEGTAVARLKKELADSSEITYHGNLRSHEIADLYRRASMLIVPSLVVESFAMVGIEAQACGCPVIVSRGGGISEWCEDGVTGLCYEKDSSDKLKDAILTLLNSPDLADQISKTALENLEGKYNLTQHTDSLIALYRRALAQ